MESNEKGGCFFEGVFDTKPGLIFFVYLLFLGDVLFLWLFGCGFFKIIHCFDIFLFFFS